MAGVGSTELEQPLRGRWPYVRSGQPYFPPEVTALGRVFKKTRWAAPYRLVVAQYREDVDHDSMHLMVQADGNWRIDHTDDANPDRGLVLEHTVKDVITTPIGAVLLTLGLTLLSGAIAYAATRR